MNVYPHPRGKVITLDPREQFALDGLRVTTVTTSNETGALQYTIAGHSLADGQFSENEAWYNDPGLLPPHIRAHVGGAELDFGPDLTETALPAAQAIQRGAGEPAQIDYLKRQAPRLAVRGRQVLGG